LKRGGVYVTQKGSKGTRGWEAVATQEGEFQIWGKRTCRGGSFKKISSRRTKHEKADRRLQGEANSHNAKAGRQGCREKENDSREAGGAKPNRKSDAA